MKVQILDVIFNDQTYLNQVSEDGDHEEVKNYECLFLLKVNNTQVVLNAQGNESECNVSYNYEDGSHEACDDFCVENTASEVWSKLEELGWENNFYYLEEHSTIQL